MTPPKPSPPHYLQQELEDLVQRDPAIFHFLQAGSLDGIWYWDLDRPDQEWMSTRFWEVLGHDPVGKPHDPAAWQDLIHPQDLETALANFRAHCDNPDHPYDQEVRYTAADGSTRWVRCRGIAIRDDTGKPIRMLGAHNDITRLKQTEAELRAHNDALQEARDALEASNEMLRNFTAAAAHDLRSPLLAMGGFADLLAEHSGDQLDALGRKCLQRIAAGSQQLAAMLTGMQALSAVSTSQVQRQPVDLAALVETTLTLLSTQIGEADADIRVGVLEPIEADPQMLGTLVQNLVANAIKFRVAERRPTIHISRPPGTVLRVQDNGVGLPPDRAPRAQELFARLHPDGRYAGEGIGLTLCSRVAHKHGWRLSFESADPGTTVTVERLRT